EQLLRKPLSHCPHRGEYSRNRLPDAGRRFNEQLLPAQNRPVNSCYQLFLTLSVREREFRPANRRIPSEPPFILPGRPPAIFPKQLLIPGGQRACVILFFKILHLF